MNRDFLYLTEVNKNEMHGWIVSEKEMIRRLLIRWLRKLNRLVDSSLCIKGIGIIGGNKQYNSSSKIRKRNRIKVEVSNKHNNHNNKMKMITLK